ncbi:hypothetical protein M422DRAFT_31558 [Sphaerobolus stellatus SS14]|uniref:Unplaced genomic scaffold SPHSTscaffold_58, whole genome shotgun sequence n=1 Tax=Sphaerobolus stellatus (strain SS14) TaxID=990650 RepID=A0A0C9VUJ8_SPHS4|nr:hypothetical protein M422DRAFT_31558 [Sphaerobolus stellatus SS14]
MKMQKRYCYADNPTTETPPFSPMSKQPRGRQPWLLKSHSPTLASNVPNLSTSSMTEEDRRDWNRSTLNQPSGTVGKSHVA